MRITKRSNIAMRVLMFCAVHSDRLVTKAEIAARAQVSESHLAQIINRLAQLGYLDTQRGRNGGLSLALPAGAIVIGEVFRVLEPAFPDTECFADADDSCPLKAACRLRPAIEAAAEAFYAHLDGITLGALVCDNAALESAFSPMGCVSVKRVVPA